MSNERGTNGAAIRRLLGVWLVTVALQMTPAHDADAQAVSPGVAQPNTKTQKPPLHGSQWIAITGKPLAATAGATHLRARRQCRRRGLRDARGDVDDVGRAVVGRRDAGADLRPAARSKVIAINGLGVAPTGATPEFFKRKGSSIRRSTVRSRRSRRERPAASC